MSIKEKQNRQKIKQILSWPSNEHHFSLETYRKLFLVLYVYMLGHLVFEMSCGYELARLRPGPDEYKSIEDSEVKEILEFIFNDGFTNGIEQVIILRGKGMGLNWSGRGWIFKSKCDN